MRTMIIVFAMLFWSTLAGAQDVPSKKTDRLYHLSQATLVGSWVLDEWTTAKGINNPIRRSYRYCSDGTSICQYPVSVGETITFREVGPASWFGIQEPNSVAIFSAGFDVGVLLTSDFLYKKGKWGRVAAIGLNFAQAGNHMVAGMGNAQKMRSAKIGLVPAGAFSVRW